MVIDWSLEIFKRPHNLPSGQTAPLKMLKDPCKDSSNQTINICSTAYLLLCLMLRKPKRSGKEQCIRLNQLRTSIVNIKELYSILYLKELFPSSS